ncbi:PrsW family glutamic-type intramembrane protease [Methanosphaerula palustris]|uniref:Protease PrsW n=1 Tax=Methanosphaerula palustris (strain ATCC BAA-1556 / DSM 19958 / E1-9c) TaxID=521011 RepID=B8GIA6_METPE|nr:PrsW family glutamic-type intramembrane protease [Methanosphaerula palustris]ACL15457.1 conserved hypothetical protein [Methanosphaerula palustris E1-9c]
MEIILVAAYLLPILFLIAFIGYRGKKFMIYLLWGIVATIPVNLLFPIFSPAFPTLPYSLTVSPLVEEFFKALPIIIPVIMGVKNSDEDLLTYAMAAGIGFSIIETWTVIDPSALQLTLVPVLSILARSFSTSLMHGCTCGIIGYGIVLIKNFDRGALPILLFGFYTLAVTIHAIFNLLSEHYQLIGTIIDLIFPVVLFFFLLTCYHVNLPILFKKTDSL